MTYKITPTNWQTHQTSLREIRELVFIQEQHVPIANEWDDKDETATHFIAYTSQGKAVACARLLIECIADKSLFHIGRVAVLSNYRKQSIGRNLMRAIISYCKEQHSDYKIYLHAQTSHQEFYEHVDFVAKGPVFIDAGIPHIEMWYVS